jgi:hypothetical protein
LPQGNALHIRNKINIFKEVRLPFCAPRLILEQIFIAQHFCWTGAKGASAAMGCRPAVIFGRPEAASRGSREARPFEARFA